MEAKREGMGILLYDRYSPQIVVEKDHHIAMKRLVHEDVITAVSVWASQWGDLNKYCKY